MKARTWGLFCGGTVLIVVGAFAFLLPFGLIWKLLATSLVVGGGFRLLAKSRGD